MAWCPASQWHPFRAVTLCAFGTMESSKLSFLPLGIEHRYRAFWWVVKFWQFLQINWPSLLEACSPRSLFRSDFFWASNQFNTAFSTESSLCVLAQSVMCISTNTHPVATHTSFSSLLSSLTMAGSQPSVQWVAPRVTPSKMDWMASGLRQVVIWLSTSATVLSNPFWHSNWKLNLARTPTHWWPVMLRLGVVIMYIKWLLSVLTKKDWYGKVLLEVFHDHLFQCQEVKFGSMVIFLMSQKGSATIGNWVVPSICLFLGEYCF